MAKFKIENVTGLDPIIVEFNEKEYNIPEPTAELLAKVDGYIMDTQVGRDSLGIVKALAVFMNIDIANKKKEGQFSEEFIKLTRMPYQNISAAVQFIQQCIINPEKHRDPTKKPEPEKSAVLSK